jgi:hypothetical protein
MPPTQISSVSKKNRGYVLISMAAVMLSLLGFAGLVVDVGYLEYYKRKAQTAADAAAQGGVAEINAGRVNTVNQAVNQDAATNGFTDGANGASVVVNNPPLSGGFVGNAKYVEVIITQSLPTVFMQALNIGSMSVKARAVGGPMSPICVYVLDPAAAGAFTITGSSAFSNTCGIIVDSSSATALVDGGTACLTATGIYVNGGDSLGTNCPPTPTPILSTPPMVDPLAYVVAPTVGPCTVNNFSTNSSATLDPGVYCGGITAHANGTVLTLHPGTYVISKGGLTIDAGVTVNGTGVTFYNTCAGPGCPSAFKSITINGGSTLNISAPTSGPLEGILFFEDRTMPSVNNIINGNNASNIVGALYFPNSSLSFSGNNSTTSYTEIVVKTLTIAGNATINNDYSSLADGGPIKDAGAMVE